MPLKSKGQVFDEFAAGGLHSGKGGKVVTSRKQAIAIALDVERRRKRKRAAEERLGKGARASG